LTLKKEFELAKIAENNEASTITVIEKASPPLFSTGSSARSNVLLAAVVGLMLGVGLAFLLEYVAKLDMKSSDNQELIGHLASLGSDARKLLSIFSLGLISAAPSPSRPDAGGKRGGK
jgi:capsular polysaccharide biosynthesis protein